MSSPTNKVIVLPSETTQALAQYLFEVYGTVRGRNDADLLNVEDSDDLAHAIQEFYDGLP